MHFWIDKRSQCAYTGRHRVPSSLSAGVGVGRSRGRVYAGRKGMPPRLPPSDCAPRRPRVTRQYGGSAMPAVHASRRVAEEARLYVEVGAEAPPQPPQPTIASLAAARSVTPDTLLRTAALGMHHSPVMAPHLKFGMLVSFALATVFLAGAKYYFDRQVSRESTARGGEAGVVCAAVACVCGVGCALTMCRARAAPPPQPPDRVSSTARRALHSSHPPHPSEPHALVDTHQAPSEPSPDASVGVSSAASPPGSSAPPPPYHIAVLLPAAAPPPAYSALS